MDHIVALGVIAKAGADGASATAIGNALVHPRVKRVPLHQREALGLATGAAVTRRGLATVTRRNRFVLKANVAFDHPRSAARPSLDAER